MPGQCGNPMMGGRRRRTAKKKLMKGGNFYGPGGAIAPGVLEWNSVENSAVDHSGTPIPDGPMPGGRRRRGKKTRKSRKGGRRRRTMRGGASSYNSAGAGWGFGGRGEAGLINPVGYASRAGGALMNADGVRAA